MLKVSFVMLLFWVYFKKHWSFFRAWMMLYVSLCQKAQKSVAKWPKRDHVGRKYEIPQLSNLKHGFNQSSPTSPNHTKSTFQLNCHYFLLLHFICFWNKVTMAICFSKQKSNSLFVSPKNSFHIIPPLGMNEVSPTCSRRSGGSSLNKRRAGRSRFHLAQKSSSWCLSCHISGKRRWGLGERGERGETVDGETSSEPGDFETGRSKDWINLWMRSGDVEVVWTCKRSKWSHIWPIYYKMWPVGCNLVMCFVRRLGTYELNTQLLQVNDIGETHSKQSIHRLGITSMTFLELYNYRLSGYHNSSTFTNTCREWQISTCKGLKLQSPTEL